MDLFTVLSIASLALAFLSALVLLLYLRKHSQSMKIMNVVWPLTALWSGVLSLLAFFSYGKGKDQPMMDMKMDDMPGMKMDMSMDMPETPFWQKVSVSTFHCGAGCTLADIIGEGIGAKYLTLLGLNGIAWNWTLDYLLALLIGVFFQYAAIRPMLTTKMSTGKVLIKAFKVDFLSLTSWQIGMYAFSYWVFFVVLSQPLPHNSWGFWFVMQLAMCVGFLFAYPMNWLLIKKGIKPAM